MKEKDKIELLAILLMISIIINATMIFFMEASLKSLIIICNAIFQYVLYAKIFGSALFKNKGLKSLQS